MRSAKHIFVIGRKNPDLDSIASCIGYAYLKNKISNSNEYIACASGSINVETQKVLSYLGAPLPNFITNLNLKVCDIMTQNIITVEKNAPITDVFKLMLKKDLRIVPIVDEENKFCGSIDMLDIARKSISAIIPDIFRKIKTKVSLIAKSLDGKILNDPFSDEEFVANVILGTMDADSFLEEIQNFDPQNVILIVANRHDIQKKAVEIGVKCLIISNNAKPSKDIIDLAKKNQVAIILSSYGSFATAGLVEWSAPISTIADKNPSTVQEGEFVKDIKEKVYSSKNRAIIVLNPFGNILGIITRTDIIKYSKRQVILIDHSDSVNAPEGIFESEVLEIIDHHRLGDIKTPNLTRYRIEPFGATATIIADEFFKNNVIPEKKIALLLASGIIVNTLFLQPDKTCDYDLKMLQWLCEKASIDYQTFSLQIRNIINT
ncbi:MAG: putative manganese-dependent inorganic diphosphatase [Desulfurella sp.]|uniref:putative manganese-dependent inorganic diphosphatase n=1 Tax=Desulfurella sp. TaxID=1962857 RepID=UPI003D0CE917